MVAFWTASALYAASLFLTLVRPRWGRHPLAVGAIVHFMAMAGRGWAIGFFPLTNKFESFSAAALALAVVCWASWRENRIYGVAMLSVAITSLMTALSFPAGLSFAPPLMYTIWYPLHVPLSFVCYALWAASAAAALVWFTDRRAEWLLMIDRFALIGFGLWSVSMICGGVWGVVAWGAYFLWDPKVIWSVILWFHYAAFVHARMTPALAFSPWVRPVLACVGFIWVFVAYVGTSFFFGMSSHAF